MCGTTAVSPSGGAALPRWRPGPCLTPHPLLAPDLIATQIPGPDLDGRDPVVEYVRGRLYDLEVHPLVDIGAYLGDHPDAANHPDGPLGHYLEVGAPAGARINGWYRPDPEREPRGLIDWQYAEARTWAERRAVNRPAWVREGPPDRPRRPRLRTRARTPSSRPSWSSSATTRTWSTPHSLQAQHGAWEAVVVGVGGPVGPLPQAHGEAPRIRVEADPQPSGWHARQAGLAQARGEYVAWMDAGEQWHPDRLASFRRRPSDRCGLGARLHP